MKDAEPVLCAVCHQGPERGPLVATEDRCPCCGELLYVHRGCWGAFERRKKEEGSGSGVGLRKG